jgi:hypothetical protein
MRKVNLPYDYLFDHSLYDLERLLKNSDMFTPSTIDSIKKIIDVKHVQK